MPNNNTGGRTLAEDKEFQNERRNLIDRTINESRGAVSVGMRKKLHKAADVMPEEDFHKVVKEKSPAKTRDWFKKFNIGD